MVPPQNVNLSLYSPAQLSQAGFGYINSNNVNQTPPRPPTPSIKPPVYYHQTSNTRPTVYQPSYNHHHHHQNVNPSPTYHQPYNSNYNLPFNLLQLLNSQTSTSTSSSIGTSFPTSTTTGTSGTILPLCTQAVLGSIPQPTIPAGTDLLSTKTECKLIKNIINK